jgi:hypothetical protein
MNELLATYFIGGRHYDVYGCYDNDTPENEFDFYDVYEVSYDLDKPSTCVNLGDPFFDMPSRNEIKDIIES